MPARIIILGGGVAGMSAAHELIERGFEVVVLERGEIAGGKARSVPVVDEGAQTTGHQLADNGGSIRPREGRQRRPRKGRQRRPREGRQRRPRKGRQRRPREGRQRRPRKGTPTPPAGVAATPPAEGTATPPAGGTPTPPAGGTPTPPAGVAATPAAGGQQRTPTKSSAYSTIVGMKTISNGN